jgi:hypothetical protein
MEPMGQQEQLQHIAQQLHGQLQRLAFEARLALDQETALDENAALGQEAVLDQETAVDEGMAASLLIDWQVQCAVRGDRLMVLVQHPASRSVEAAPIFQTLEQAIPELPREWLEALLPELGAAAVPVKLYLRELGLPKPYASHQFELGAYVPDLLDESLLELPPLEDAEPFGEGAATEPDLTLPDLTLPDLSLSLDDLIQSDQVQTEPERSEPDPKSRALVLWAGLSGRKMWAALAKPMTAIAQPAEQRPEWFNSDWWWIVAGGVATVACVGTSAFMLTRPCVVGACQPLQVAADLSQQLAQPNLSVVDGSSFQSVRAELLKTRRLVNTIPMWSSRYGDAQAMIAGLNGAIGAERSAEQASQKGQATAQPVTEWQAVQSSWREAIAQLAEIPKTNPMSTFAQKRLLTYRAQLAQVDRRIATEQEARRRLLTAKKTAQLAETRQNGAQQLQDWQSAQSTWQVVVNTLRQTPPGTTTEAESEQLLQSYQPKLDATRDRASQEFAARKAYLQALQFQKRARAHRKQNQWPQTASLLQSALTYAQQVPSGTTSFDLAQVMIPSLSADLEQAQAIVKSRLDLSRVCAASGKICNYTIKPTGIQVRFTPTYEHRVNDLKAASAQTADPATIEQVNQHIASLEAALQTVSNTAQVPIQVYSSSNQLVGSFSPGG